MHGKSTKGDGSKEAELRRRGVGREAGWKGAENEIQILEAEGEALAMQSDGEHHRGRSGQKKRGIGRHWMAMRN